MKKCNLSIDSKENQNKGIYIVNELWNGREYTLCERQLMKILYYGIYYGQIRLLW